MPIKFLSENLKGRDCSENLQVDRKTEWILGKYGGKVGTGCIWLQAHVNTVMNLQAP